MANTKISQLTANTNPNGNEEFVYAYNNANGKITLDTMKTYIGSGGGSYAAGTGIDITAGVISNTGVTSVNGQTGNVIVSGGGGQVEYDYSAMQGPCSTGYHIPSQGEWQTLYNAGITMSAWTSSGIIEWRTYLKMPPTGVRRYSDGDVTQQINQLHYWTYIPYQTEDAYSMVYVGGFNLAQHTHRANAVMIRPFKDTPVIPDITWTTLYDGSGTAAGAGIFYNSGLGVISISADGTNWITIADKNLGATVVYNQGDTLASTNVGTYFQRGNNYGFAYTGAITTSGTQVDGSTYGPGNYYSSSTFITGHNDWSSVQNDNLWGYTTGPVPSGGGTSITELSGDANIWELSEGIYVTDYDLYYTTGNKVRFYIAGGGSGRQMLFVVNQSGRGNAFFVYNVGHNSQYTQPRCSYGYSKSSSEGETHLVREWDASLQEYAIVPGQTDIDAIGSGGGLGFTQLINDAEDNQSLRVAGTVYSGTTYTIIINSVKTSQTYSITLGTGVTNPLNITLPNLSNKKCVITMVATSTSTAIVTGCTIES